MAHGRLAPLRDPRRATAIRARWPPTSSPRLLGARATVAPGANDDGEHFRLEPVDGIPLGAAIAALADGGIDVLACRQERSEIEEAFLALTGERG